MSLEQSIADLQTQAGLLLDLPQTITDQAVAQIESVTNTYNTRVAGWLAQVYIDAANGDDANPGTDALPVQTIARAVMLTPRGGVCHAILKGDIIILDNINLEGRHLLLMSNSSVRHNVQFNRYIDNQGNQTYRALRQIRVSYGSHIFFNGLTINMPENDGVYSAHLTGYMSSIVGPQGYASTGGNLISFDSCTINLPATIFGPLLGLHGTVFTLQVMSCSFPNQAPNGRWLSTYTNTAGTNVVDVPNLISNLTTI